MATIAQRDLRNASGDILRRVEAGERFVVTMAGRPVAELSPIRRPARTLTGDDVNRLLARNVPDDGLLDDLRGLPAGLASESDIDA